MTGYISAVKLGVQVVSGLGIGKIVTSIVKSNVPVVSTVDKILVYSGSYAISAMIIEQANNHIDRQAKDAVDLIDKMVETRKAELASESEVE